MRRGASDQFGHISAQAAAVSSGQEPETARPDGPAQAGAVGFGLQITLVVADLGAQCVE
jgi:hypothetical protein